MASDDDYKVGYRNPPKETRFKKGHSGNPKGRRSRKKSVEEAVRSILTEPVEIKVGGKLRKVPMFEAALMRLRMDALSGSPSERRQAIKLLRDMFPDFQIEPPAQREPLEQNRKVLIEIIESDGNGGLYEPTREERARAKEFILRERAEAAAKRLLRQPGLGPLDD